MTTMRIRAATPADLDAVSGMVAALNEEEGCDRADAAGAEALRAAFLGPRACGVLLVAEGESDLDGYVTLHATFEAESGTRGCYIGDLFVRHDARRRGLGRALVAAAARTARSQGGSFLWWTALPKNAAGLAFYRALRAEAEPIFVLTLAGKAFDRLAAEAAP